MPISIYEPHRNGTGFVHGILIHMQLSLSTVPIKIEQVKTNRSGQISLNYHNAIKTVYKTKFFFITLILARGARWHHNTRSSLFSGNGLAPKKRKSAADNYHWEKYWKICWLEYSYLLQNAENSMKQIITCVKASSFLYCILYGSPKYSQIVKFMGPTWGPSGSCRPQMKWAQWTLLSGLLSKNSFACTTVNILTLYHHAWPCCYSAELLIPRHTYNGKHIP